MSVGVIGISHQDPQGEHGKSMDQPSILVFGRDPSLLETRAWILEKTGAIVLSATSLSQVEKIAASRNIRLLVICHSVSPADCEELLAFVNSERPETEKLLMTANTPVCPLGQKERTVSAFSGPSVLLEAATAMLQTRSSSTESR